MYLFYGLFITIIILLLKLSQIWPLETPSVWFLCPFDMLLSYWGHSLLSGTVRYSKLILYFPSSKEPWFFYSETEIWVLGASLLLNSLLLGHLSGQRWTTQVLAEVTPAWVWLVGRNYGCNIVLIWTISLNGHMACLSVILWCCRITRLWWLCNKRFWSKKGGGIVCVRPCIPYTRVSM